MIEETLHLYLTQIANGQAKPNEEQADEFAQACKDAWLRMFEKEKEFTLRMSAVGRPYCQQWMHKADVDKDNTSYSLPMKFLIGDVLEAAVTTLCKGAGLNVEKVQEPVELEIGGIKLEGTYDIKIDGKIWDIKSSSPYAFNNKFRSASGFSNLVNDDPFGYVTQGYLYGEADKSKFGGWIGVEKVTGEIAVLETPPVDNSYRKRAIHEAERTIREIKEDAPFRRCFEPIIEVFNRKKTGNKYLDITCSYCPYKQTCWADEGIQNLPQPASKAVNPKRFWYVGKVKG